jgi:serine protease Do
MKRIGSPLTQFVALLVCALLLALPTRAQAPDFTALVREGAGAVVNVSGSLRLVLPDLPLAEDEEEVEEGVLRDFLGRQSVPSPELRSLGAGFVIDESGYIITNAHLVDSAERGEVVVRLADRREYEARVVGFDPISDIALLKIEASGLPAVRTGDPAKLRPGEWVAAIGSPFGLERSVTAGIVSAVGRTLPEENFIPFIQTDVAVNPGNSGGPLFNLRGEVVGVNSGIYSDTGGYMGLSFAIPIDVAMEIAAQLRAHGKVTRGRIGVRLQEVTAELAKAFKLAQPSGALILDAFKGGAAERAAIRPGDVVVRFDGKTVESDADLVRLTAGAKPGTTVEIELVRFGAPLTARVRVDEARSPAPMPPALLKRESEPLGLQAAPLNPLQRERLRVEGGLLVERPGQAGQRAGLVRGDLILSVNGKSVATMAEFHRLAESAGRGATLALLVQREGIRQFVPLRLPR